MRRAGRSAGAVGAAAVAQGPGLSQWSGGQRYRCMIPPERVFPAAKTPPKRVGGRDPLPLQSRFPDRLQPPHPSLLPYRKIRMTFLNCSGHKTDSKRPVGRSPLPHAVGHPRGLPLQPHRVARGARAGAQRSHAGTAPAPARARHRVRVRMCAFARVPASRGGASSVTSHLPRGELSRLRGELSLSRRHVVPGLPRARQRAGRAGRDHAQERGDKPALAMGLASSDGSSDSRGRSPPPTIPLGFQSVHLPSSPGYAHYSATCADG